MQGVSEELIHDSIDRLVAMQYLYVENTRIYPFTLHEDEVVIAKELKNHCLKWKVWMFKIVSKRWSFL